MQGTDSPTGKPDSGAATAAGLYAALLGNEQVTAADKAGAERVLRSAPELGHLALLNWEWVRRVVRFLSAECGIRQFIDLGAGILTPPLMHEAHPDTHVAYVDSDLGAVTKSREILGTAENAAYIHADVCETETVLGHPDVRALLDFSQPIGIIMGSLIHFIPDDANPASLVRTYVQGVPSGSFLALTCAVRDLISAELLTEFARSVKLYKSQTMARPDMRDRAAVETYVAGLDLVAPGIVPPGRWRPDGHSLVDKDSVAQLLMLAAVARTP